MLRRHGRRLGFQWQRTTGQRHHRHQQRARAGRSFRRAGRPCGDGGRSPRRKLLRPLPQPGAVLGRIHRHLGREQSRAVGERLHHRQLGAAAGGQGRRAERQDAASGLRRRQLQLCPLRGRQPRRLGWEHQRPTRQRQRHRRPGAGCGVRAWHRGALAVRRRRIRRRGGPDRSAAGTDCHDAGGNRHPGHRRGAQRQRFRPGQRHCDDLRIRPYHRLRQHRGGQSGERERHGNHSGERHPQRLGGGHHLSLPRGGRQHRRAGDRRGPDVHHHRLGGLGRPEPERRQFGPRIHLGTDDLCGHGGERDGERRGDAGGGPRRSHRHRQRRAGGVRQRQRGGQFGGRHHHHQRWGHRRRGCHHAWLHPQGDPPAGDLHLHRSHLRAGDSGRLFGRRPNREPRPEFRAAGRHQPHGGQQHRLRADPRQLRQPRPGPSGEPGVLGRFLSICGGLFRRHRQRPGAAVGQYPAADLGLQLQRSTGPRQSRPQQCAGGRGHVGCAVRKNGDGGGGRLGVQLRPHLGRPGGGLGPSRQRPTGKQRLGLAQPAGGG